MQNHFTVQARRAALMVLALLLLFSGSCRITSLGAETEIEEGDSVSGKMLEAETEAEYPILENALDAAFRAAGWFDDRLHDSMEEVSRLRSEQRASLWAQRVLGMELLDAWNRLSQITEETPWLIRVNQTTCTVTVYRVLEVERRDREHEAKVEALRREIMQEEDAGQEQAGRQISFRKVENQEEETSQKEILYVPVYACPCSVGVDGRTPNGVYTIQDHLRWHELVGPRWGQWCCHFAPSYLFHSLPYERPNDPASLEEGSYNLIGQPASHGCVRLAAVDAKYIYDHVPTGGKVEIFSGDEADDPLGKPERPYVGDWEEPYDPTDPEYGG